MANTRGAVGNRLSEDDWIQAGYAILAAEGLKALRIDRLRGRLDVTEGSFCWHFDGMPSYRTALVESWGELRDQDRRHIDDIRAIPPRERLSVTMTSSDNPRPWTLERAMREWARSDEAVAASVRTADRRLLRAVRQAFLDYGFEQEEADGRASVTFAAGVGFVRRDGREPAGALTPGLGDPADGGVRWTACPALR
jgi:AcrR family transcriptional regulator